MTTTQAAIDETTPLQLFNACEVDEDVWQFREDEANKIRAALTRQSELEKAAEGMYCALVIIFKTHDLSCKGEECQISGIDLGHDAVAAYRRVVEGK